MTKKKKTNDEPGVGIAAVAAADAMDEKGLMIAFLRVNTESGELQLNWLPTLFNRPIPPEFKKAIVEKLRFHADKMESGEMEQRMQRFTAVNDPPGTDWVQ